MSNLHLTSPAFRQQPSVIPNVDPAAPMALVLAVDLIAPGIVELGAVGDLSSQSYRWQVMNVLCVSAILKRFGILCERCVWWELIASMDGFRAVRMQ